jgi:hypothetical protein
MNRVDVTSDTVTSDIVTSDTVTSDTVTSDTVTSDTKDRPICRNDLFCFLSYFYLKPDVGHVGPKQVESLLLFNKYS